MPTLKRRFDAAVKAFQDPSLTSRPPVEIPGALKTNGKVRSKLLKAQGHLANAYRKKPERWERIQKITNKALDQAGLESGSMLEIGGRLNPRAAYFPNFEYSALDLEDAPGADVHVTTGDITNCPHIPDNTYDFVFSLDVFEHIDKPWLAASEIQRILKPGGVTVHSTLFAWRYHPCPIDYWRYSAEGLKSLFDQLECVHAKFDYTERRRSIMGKDKNRLEEDALGGWRENVRVNYAGIKRA